MQTPEKPTTPINILPGKKKKIVNENYVLS